MDLELNGRRVLVTGSNTGIGKGIARTLAAEGATVIVHGRNEARAERTANDLIDRGGKAEFAVGDLSTPEGAQAVIEQVSAGGHLDILVNNAGGSQSGAISDWLETSDELWLSTYEANVLSAVRLIRAFVPPMKARGWGRVINITSSGAMAPMAEIPEYQAAKAAMLSMTLSLARALAETGITANSVSPGPILTPAPRHWMAGLAEKRGVPFEELAAEIARDQYNVSVGRWGTTDEIGTVVALLASPKSGFTNGADFHVDGGAMPAMH